MDINWICKSFEELTIPELYEILQLRSAIFVVEQNCPYQDLDNKDKYAHHLLCMQNNRLIGYTRLIPTKISYKEASIGRVVIHADSRALGLGKILMEKSIATIFELWGVQPIKIGAQLYLKKFYESLGFIQTSDVYDEDGIDHIEMLLSQ